MIEIYIIKDNKFESNLIAKSTLKTRHYPFRRYEKLRDKPLAQLTDEEFEYVVDQLLGEALRGDEEDGDD